MVVVEPSKKAEVVYAVAAVSAVAIVMVTGSPLLLDYMAANSLPDWVYWAVSMGVVVSGLTTYWALLPVGAVRNSRTTAPAWGNDGDLRSHRLIVGRTADGMRGPD